MLRRLRLTDSYGTTPLGFLVVCILVLGSLVSIGVFIGTNIDGRNCALIQEHTGRDTQWDLFGGCYIQKQDGTYVPMGKYHMVDNEEN